MVQQLSLFSSIDDKSYDLFIATMNTVSGNPPILYAKVSTVWIPNPSLQIEGANSKGQLVEKTRIKVSTDIPLSMLQQDSSSEPLNTDAIDHTILKTFQDSNMPINFKTLQDMMHGTDRINDEKQNAWCLSISDIPAAGNNRKVSMQTINESILLSHVGSNSNIETIMNELGYIFQYQYVTIGTRFNLKHNLILELQKIWNITESSKKQITKGGFLIKAFINVDKATDIDKMNLTESVLLNLQKELQGYITLAVPDRKSMDSRLVID
ncbi:Mediator of RNA polymerase II transcription subunit 18 [Maudiozyma exigua]|uniref:Mediator of RNA polymerase II transcription subunit 18 n=1 Tax=Maudiozyma exigua TaxID=34358 RepID=A0A9P6WB64_MAUEX|nr:Mediator of RNA polymerase II transcription subunit 18 [Kazachstania exigua]